MIVNPPMRVNDPSSEMCTDWRCVGHGWHHPGYHQEPLDNRGLVVGFGQRIQEAHDVWVLMARCRAWLSDHPGYGIAFDLYEPSQGHYCVAIVQFDLDFDQETQTVFTTSKPTLLECLVDAHEWVNTR